MIADLHIFRICFDLCGDHDSITRFTVVYMICFICAWMELFAVTMPSENARHDNMARITSDDIQFVINRQDYISLRSNVCVCFSPISIENKLNCNFL